MEELERSLLDGIDCLERQISLKARRNVVEQIERRQEEKIRGLAGISNLNVTLEINTNSEATCMESVEAGDLNTAFGTILRYIDTIAQAKAERKDVEAKAATEYAEQLFQRLAALSKQQIDNTTAGLQTTIEAELEGLENEFTCLKRDIEAAVDEAERNVAELANEVAQYGIVREQQTMKRHEMPSGQSGGFESRSASQLTPRRQALKKSFEMSQRRNLAHYQKPQPKICDLTSAMRILQ